MIQTVKIPAGTILPKDQIKRCLDKAWDTHEYAKFILSSGIYVSVTYNRDRSVTIATNSRDYTFYDEYQAVMKMPTPMRIVELLFRWLPRLKY